MADELRCPVCGGPLDKPGVHSLLAPVKPECLTCPLYAKIVEVMARLIAMDKAAEVSKERG